MSDAAASHNPIPDGWYDDPATPNMQRWWDGSNWSEHVRYSDRPHPHAASSPTPYAAAPTPYVAAVEPVQQAQPAYQLPEKPARTDLQEGFDSFYVPMRTFEPSASIGTPRAPRRRSANAVAIWLVSLAAIGVAIGAILWVFLPR